MKRKKSIHGKGAGALTPYLPAGNELLEQQTTLALLESRVNGQQSRLHDCDRFIDVLKRENAALRILAKNLRDAIFENLTMRPSPAEKQ